jgi:phosphatidylserine/phosphatidylglycerophosphate/cardiolipin synthase-like enzyme
VVVAGITLTFLRDTRHGGSAGQPGRVASSLASFVAAATRSVDVAIYDFRLGDALATTVVGALTAAADRGVAVRIAYDVGKPDDADAQVFTRLQADPAPPGTAEFVADHFAGTAVATMPITAGSQLMHEKYVVRDAARTSATVWTGSANFTDDAWTLQENNIVRLRSSTLADAYRADFDAMWASGAIAGTGRGLAGSTPIGDAGVAWDFAPGDGAAIDAALVAMVAAATQRVDVATMVLTSHGVLAALVAAIERGVPISGIYDAGQMDPIAAQWARSRSAASKQALADWQRVSASLVPKHSTPFTPTSPHDFMHHKVIVADDVVATGSYNVSANAQRNGENHVRISSPAIAARYRAHIATIARAYGRPSASLGRDEDARG